MQRSIYAEGGVVRWLIGSNLERAGSNPVPPLILLKPCVPTQEISRKPFTAEGKSAADVYICHMYVLLAYQEHMLLNCTHRTPPFFDPPPSTVMAAGLLTKKD